MKTVLFSILFFTLIAKASFAASPSIGTNRDDPFAKLSDVDRDHYKISLSYALEVTEDNQVYEWRTNSAEGQIRPGKRFTSQSGVTCRPFAETFMVEKTNGQNSGFGCKRQGNDGWCKLREGNMLNCALDEPEGILDKLTRDADRTEQKGTEYKRRSEDTFWNWWPFW